MRIDICEGVGPSNLVIGQLNLNETPLTETRRLRENTLNI